MRRLFLLILFVLALAYPVGAKPLQAFLFTSPSCPHCRHLKDDGFIESFRQKYQGQIELKDYDLTQEANNVLFMVKMQKHPEAQLGIPALFLGDTLLQGYPTDIGTQADQAAQAWLAAQPQEIPSAQPAQPGKVDTPAAPVQKPVTPAAQEVPAPQENPAQASTAQEIMQAHQMLFGQITFWAIVGAGLVDGINPCAFAVIVFFVSFLAAYKYTKKEIIVVGVSYCFAVFLAYVLMGFGAFKFLYALRAFHYVTLAVQWGTIVLCAIFLVLCCYDFIIYQRTKKSEKMLLQLSKSNKEYIHKVMRFFLKDKHSSLWRLLGASFVVGFVVSGVEAVCTGQVYLPTIIVILKQAGEHFWKAAFYLLTYNLMFILPLVLVFVLTLCGKESAAFNNFLKKHLGLTKLLLCGVFLGLLVLLLKNMF
ncbi:MAG: hypothetical protein J6Y25_03600 [Elusimicrobiaceae bacterium]|nr:hypothetical protein [Elusimicrobiaceae bacterium]